MPEGAAGPLLQLLQVLGGALGGSPAAAEEGTPKRPQPEFPAAGFLGELPNLDGSSSTELSVTIPHPTMPGHWTNVPLLFPGQDATDILGAPGLPTTAEQHQRAADFARTLAESGYHLPAFKTVDEAVFQAEHRHKAVAAQPSQFAPVEEPPPK
jgi:hypothetical protein